MLEDRVAIVTGAARGIGLATAKLFAENGARVVLADVDAAELDAAAAQFEGNVITIAGDITHADEPDRIVATAIETWGRLDILINNAGYTDDAPLHKLSDGRFQAMLDIHTVAPFRMLRAAAPHLREPAKQEMSDGREVFRKVVNVTSVAATMGNATQANYAAGKAALIGLTKTMAKEWGPFRVNVNAVAFGMIDTRLTAAGDGAPTQIGDREVSLGVPEQTRAFAEMVLPLGRPGTTNEAAGPVLFLSSPLSNYVTGQVLTVSGGLPLGMS